MQFGSYWHALSIFADSVNFKYFTVNNEITELFQDWKCYIWFYRVQPRLEPWRGITLNILNTSHFQTRSCNEVNLKLTYLFSFSSSSFLVTPQASWLAASWCFIRSISISISLIFCCKESLSLVKLLMVCWLWPELFFSCPTSETNLIMVSLKTPQT